MKKDFVTGYAQRMALQAEITKLTQEFLERGNQITVVPKVYSHLERKYFAKEIEAGRY